MMQIAIRNSSFYSNYFVRWRKCCI